MSLLIFAVGAMGYSTLEYLFRGYTHWSMALTGGACLLVFYYYAKARPHASLLSRAGAGALIITVFEFCVGLLVNRWYGWHVWDYSELPGNIMGQICPLFSFLWFLLCLMIVLISDWIQSIYNMVRSRQQG